MKILTLPHKKLRAMVIRDFVVSAGYKGVVVFSCGNAARELKKQLLPLGLKVITPKVKRWYSQTEIAQKYKGYFDATSGHLPLWLMAKIASAFKVWLNRLPNKSYIVPTGSGECILCLKMAYPKTNFVAWYNIPGNKGTKFEALAPLNPIIKNFFKTKNYGQ